MDGTGLVCGCDHDRDRGHPIECVRADPKSSMQDRSADENFWPPSAESDLRRLFVAMLVSLLLLLLMVILHGADFTWCLCCVWSCMRTMVAAMYEKGAWMTWRRTKLILSVQYFVDACDKNMMLPKASSNVWCCGGNNLVHEIKF